MKKGLPYNTLRIVSIVLLIIVALNALAAGFSFITDPSGAGLGITTAYLKPSAPFKDFFMPGLVLFVVNGLASMAVAIVAIQKTKQYSVLVLLQGAVYVGWIAAQLTMVTAFHLLHLLIAFIGFLLIACGWLLMRWRAR